MKYNKLQKIHQGWQWFFYMYEEWLLLMSRRDDDGDPWTIEMDADEFFDNLNFDYPYLVETSY